MTQSAVELSRAKFLSRTAPTNTCRFCKKLGTKMVKYEVRHYAHFDCYLAAGKKLSDLSAWKVAQFPYRLLKEYGLIEEAELIAREVARFP